MPCLLYRDMKFLVFFRLLLRARLLQLVHGQYLVINYICSTKVFAVQQAQLLQPSLVIRCPTSSHVILSLSAEVNEHEVI